MGFGNFFGQRSQVEPDEKVIQITTYGKSALQGQNVSGMEFDILDEMKSGHPFTIDNLVQKLQKERRYIRMYANSLLRKKYIEVTNG
jgi:hypothetical protein